MKEIKYIDYEDFLNNYLKETTYGLELSEEKNFVDNLGDYNLERYNEDE